MKILFLALRGFDERTSHFTYRLPLFFSARGAEIVVVSPTNSTVYTGNFERLKVLRRSAFSLFSGFTISPGTWIELLRHEPDLIHVTAYGTIEGYLAYLYARLKGIPMVITCDLTPNYFLERSPNALKRIFARLFTRPVLEYAEKIVFTQAEKDLLSSAGYSGMNVIPIGIDYGRFSPAKDKKKLRAELDIPSNARILMTLVRVDEPRKGLRYMLEAQKELPEFTFLLVGFNRGEDIQRLERIKKEENIPNIRFLPIIPHKEIPNRLAVADAYVCTSFEESFATSRVEAVASGLPVITTKVGAEVPAIYIEKGDAKGLVAAVRKLFSNASVLNSHINKKWAEDYDWQKIADKTFELYERALSARKHGNP